MDFTDVDEVGRFYITYYKRFLKKVYIHCIAREIVINCAKGQQCNSDITLHSILDSLFTNEIQRISPETINRRFVCLITRIPYPQDIVHIITEFTTSTMTFIERYKRNIYKQAIRMIAEFSY